jgi:regulatory protein
MARISAIVASSRKEGRFVVQVEGGDDATVSLEIIERLELRVGGEVDEPLAARLLEESAALAAYDRGLNMLAFQARSSRDLQRRLVQKGEAEAHATSAVERLVAAGLLNDAEFARQVARSKLTGQGASKRRLQQELFKRGVERSVADGALGVVVEQVGVDQDEIVERFARKKLRSLGTLDAATRRRRLYAFLARRGHEGDVIRRVMATVLDGAEVAELDQAALGDDT